MCSKTIIKTSSLSVFVTILSLFLLCCYEGKSQSMNNWNGQTVSEADVYTAKCIINGNYELPNYSDKEIKDVFNRLLTYANNGHVESMYYVAFMYQYFRTVGLDLDKAFYWYLKAANLGHEQSILAVGDSYLRGKDAFCNQPINFHKAEKWLLILAEKGNVKALNDLGYLYSIGCSKDDKFDETEDDFPANLNKSLAMYTEAANKGSAYAMYWIGELYRVDFHDAKKSLEWYEKAIKNGSYDAARALGHLYFYGDEELRSFPVHVDVDYKKALEYYTKELELCTFDLDANNAKEHIAETCYNLGRIYDDCGISGTESMQEAIKWYRLAAEQGYEDAAERFKKAVKLLDDTGN